MKYEPFQKTLSVKYNYTEYVKKRGCFFCGSGKDWIACENPQFSKRTQKNLIRLLMVSVMYYRAIFFGLLVSQALLSQSESALVRALWPIYNTFFRSPLHYVYLHGPRLRSSIGIVQFDLGFWGGLSHAELCAEVTHTSPRVWVSATSECEKLIESRFHSFEVGVLFLLYCWALLLLVQLLWMYGVRRYMQPYTHQLYRAIEMRHHHLQLLTLPGTCVCAN